MCLRQDGLFMSMPAATSFLAHLRSPNEGQLLKDHLLSISTITARLAAKTGMHTILANTPPPFRSTSAGLRA